MVFEISPSEIFLPPPITLTTTTRSYPQLYDVSALALLSPKTSRFVGLTTYRCRVRFQGLKDNIIGRSFKNKYFIRATAFYNYIIAYNIVL